jgi:hypothetical protein
LKIIQTFWSGGNSMFANSYGWLNVEAHLLSWVLSSNQLRKYYDNVELITDKQGYSLLIEELGLPYTNVHVILDDLNYPSTLWALAKIKSYSIQDKPFLHVDGDVFIWDRFSENLLRSKLIAQNLEYATIYTRNMWDEINPQLQFKPTCLEKFCEEAKFHSCNMGIFGGSDLCFIKKYCSLAQQFVDMNREAWKNINLFNFNIFFEQALFFMLTHNENKNLSFYFDKVIDDNKYDLSSFDRVSSDEKLLHIIGSPKKNILVTSKLRSYVVKYYPDYYKKIVKALSVRNIIYYDSCFENTLDSQNELIEHYYQMLVFKRDLLSMKNSSTRILIRDIFMQDKVSLFQQLRKTSKSFNIFPLPDFEIDFNIKTGVNCIIVKHLNDNFFETELLSIDEIIFCELGQGGDSKSFSDKMLLYLSDDFPEEEKNNFQRLIWERLEFLISARVFVAL